MRAELQRLQKENEALMQLKQLEIENIKLKQSNPATSTAAGSEDIQRKEAELAGLMKKQEDLANVMELEESLHSGDESDSQTQAAAQAEAQAQAAAEAEAQVAAEAQAMAEAEAQARAQAQAQAQAEAQAKAAAAAELEAKAVAEAKAAAAAEAQAKAAAAAQAKAAAAAAAAQDARAFAAEDDAEALLLVQAAEGDDVPNGDADDAEALALFAAASDPAVDAAVDAAGAAAEAAAADAAAADAAATEAAEAAAHAAAVAAAEANEAQAMAEAQAREAEERRMKAAEEQAAAAAEAAAEAAARAAAEAMSMVEQQAAAAAVVKTRAELANKAEAEAKAAVDEMAKAIAHAKSMALEAAKAELARLQAVNTAESQAKARAPAPAQVGFLGGAAPPPANPSAMGAEGLAKIAAQSIAEAQSATMVAAASEASSNAEKKALEAAVAVIKTIEAAEEKAVMASSVVDSFVEAKLECDLITATDHAACHAAASEAAAQKAAIDQARAEKAAADVAAAEKAAYDRAESAKAAAAKAAADKAVAEAAATKAIADDGAAKKVAAEEAAAAKAAAEEAARLQRAAEEAAAAKRAKEEAEAAEVAARMKVVEDGKKRAAKDPMGEYESIEKMVLSGEGNAEDWDEAKRVADELAGHLLQAVKNGTAPPCGDVWHIEPAVPVRGGKVTVYYNAGATCLAGVKQYGSITLTTGCNNFEEPEKIQMKEVKGRFKVNGKVIKAVKGSWWQKAEVEVPDEAFVMDFVFSDGGNVYDNNDRRDYHSPVKGAEETLDVQRFQRSCELYFELVDERIVREKRAKERAERRAITKKKTKKEAAAVTRRQREHVLYTEPAEPTAGDMIRVHYNPRNTNLAQANEVYIIGGWNRWSHEESIGPIKMTPGEGSHVVAEFPVPSDAYKMDFVFASSSTGKGEFDNNNKLDYHIDIVGGVDKVTGQPMKEPPLHVVSICVEMAPIAKVGGLGDVVTSLARAVQDEGHNVEVIIPKHDTIDYSQVEGLVETTGFSWGMTYNRVFYGKVEGVDTYFIDPENGMFRVGMIYGTDYLEIPMTDAERFGFFSKAALEWLLQSGRQPDIIHCHDWQTAPCARSYWEDYNPYGLSNPRVVFTIHNMNYGAELIKEALTYSQVGTTVSRTYAEEISGHPSVSGALGKFHGVVNGIDPDIWDPANDEFLPRFFDATDVVEGKAAAREALCAHSNIPNKPGVPMVGIVTRLTPQKGIHLIKHGVMRALERGCQVILLGTAPDPVVQQDFDMMFHELKQRYYDSMCFHLYYNEPLSHLIYAGADMLIVPSMFEPCGLSQLIAMRYGTVPVVRRTGGLNDTVFDYDLDHKKAEWEGMKPNGFSFDGTDEGAIDYALNRAIDLAYNKPAEFRKLQANCMTQDWSWNRPALEYIEVYHAARKPY